MNFFKEPKYIHKICIFFTSVVVCWYFFVAQSALTFARETENLYPTFSQDTLRKILEKGDTRTGYPLIERKKLIIRKIPVYKKPANSILSDPIKNRKPLSGTGYSGKPLLDKQIKKLALYEEALGDYFGHELMVFVIMPQTQASIRSLAISMRNITTEYSSYGIVPLFVFEPYDEHRKELDFKKLKKGEYNANLHMLFSLIKYEYKVGGKNIGTIIPYPEINTPAFKKIGFASEDFPILVNTFFDIAQKYYPDIRGGLLLDSKSYPMGKNWGDGDFVSFKPYIEGIKPGNIDIFGIQGFPWVSTDNKINAYDASEYLPIDITIEAANILGTKDIWFNTGVMKKKYTSQTINFSSKERSEILLSILNQAQTFKNNGYAPSINIFAQDKFSLFEGTDWSFLGDPGDVKVLKSFLSQAKNADISVSVFDK